MQPPFRRGLYVVAGLLCSISSALAQTDLKQWMNGLNDNLYISQMSLPGAHDAATENLLVGQRNVP